MLPSLKRRFVETQKQRPSRKIYSKVLHQAIDPLVGVLCPTVMAGGVATEDLPLALKVLISPKVRNSFLPPTSFYCQVASSSKSSPGLPIIEVFVIRGSSVQVPTGRNVTIFPEKLRRTVQRPSCTKYSALFRSTSTEQIPKARTNVQEELSVSGYRNPGTLR